MCRKMEKASVLDASVLRSLPSRLLGAHRAPFRGASLAFHSMSIPEVSSLTPFCSRLPVLPLIRVKYLTPADRDRWGGGSRRSPPAQLG